MGRKPLALRVFDGAGNVTIRPFAARATVCRIFVRGAVDQSLTDCVKLGEPCVARRYRWNRAKPRPLRCVNKKVRYAPRRRT